MAAKTGARTKQAKKSVGSEIQAATSPKAPTSCERIETTPCAYLRVVTKEVGKTTRERVARSTVRLRPKSGKGSQHSRTPIARPPGLRVTHGVRLETHTNAGRGAADRALTLTVASSRVTSTTTTSWSTPYEQDYVAGRRLAAHVAHRDDDSAWNRLSLRKPSATAAKARLASALDANSHTWLARCQRAAASTHCAGAHVAMRSHKTRLNQNTMHLRSVRKNQR